MDTTSSQNTTRKSYTQIKFNKSSCYFCNEWLEDDQIKDHLIVCGQVLEKCALNCGAYLQRKDIEQHSKKCATTTTIRVNGTESTTPAYRAINEMEKRLEMLQEDLSLLRSTMNEEIRERLKLVTDLGGLRKRNQLTDEWTHKVGDILGTLKRCVNEETESRCYDVKKCQEDMKQLVVQNNNFEHWSVQMTMKLNEIQNEFIKEDNVRGQVDVLMHDNRITVAKIKNLEVKLEELAQTSLTRPSRGSSNHRDLTIVSDRIAGVGMILDAHRKHLEGFTAETNQQLEDFNVRVQATDAAFGEVISKIGSLDFELKSLKNIVHESEDKGEKLEKLVDKFRHETYYTKQRLDDVEENSKYQKHLLGIVNTTGHLIWRIEEYSVKLADAKVNDVTLKSPMFTNRPYGYTLRLDVNLNGIGTWKGRNLNACLSVIHGEYDALLPWPCTLKAEIIVRDQPDDISTAQNFVKTIVTKRKNEKFEKNQYIYIPHATIATRNFVKNDTMYLEVVVHDDVV